MSTVVLYPPTSVSHCAVLPWICALQSMAANGTVTTCASGWQSCERVLLVVHTSAETVQKSKQQELGSKVKTNNCTRKLATVSSPVLQAVRQG